MNASTPPSIGSQAFHNSSKDPTIYIPREGHIRLIGFPIGATTTTSWNTTRPTFKALPLLPTTVWKNISPLTAAPFPVHAKE